VPRYSPPDSQTVSQEKHIELATFGRAGEIDIMSNVNPGIGIRSRMPP
jgi:hypothetical protein